MCGAAAESAILQTAIAKVGDEDKVLEQYLTSNGRGRVMEMIFGASPSKLQEKFISSAANLLFYWRDETAHGQISTVSEIEAFHSLTTLFGSPSFFSEIGNPLQKPQPLEGLDWLHSIAHSRSAGPSFFTLFASGEAGCITSSSEGAGTSSRFSESGSSSRGLIQSSAARSSRMTGIRS